MVFDLYLLLRHYKRMPECSFCVISDMIVIAFQQNKVIIYEVSIILNLTLKMLVSTSIPF